MPRMTMHRLMAWVNHVAVKTWPDGSTLRHVRAHFSKAVNRVIVGAVVGLVIGLLSALIGIGLSGVDVSDPATSNQMVKLVVKFMGMWAIILACIADLAHLYMRFLCYLKWASARKIPGKDRNTWDDEIDVFLPSSSSTGNRQIPDRGV